MFYVKSSVPFRLALQGLAFRMSVDAAEYSAYYSALLDDLQPTVYHVHNAIFTAIRYLWAFKETWSALSGRLIKLNSDDMAGFRSTWFVIDGLMKAAPLIFVPTISPKLADMVEHYFPWNYKGDSSEIAWCSELVDSWSTVLPAGMFSSISARASKQRGAFELSRANIFDSGATLNAEAEKLKPASRAELESLREEWEKFEAVLFPTTNPLGSVRVKTEGAVKLEQIEGAPPPMSFTNTKAAPVVVEDEEYIPEYASTATMEKILPDDEPEDKATSKQLQELGAQQQLAAKGPREKRKRPREADETQ